jgi:hypothetical protein
MTDEAKGVKLTEGLSDGQIWLLECGEHGFCRTTLKVPFSGHGSTATNHMCAGLIRRGWLEKSNVGIIRLTPAGRKALSQEGEGT